MSASRKVTRAPRPVKVVEVLPLTLRSPGLAKCGFAHASGIRGVVGRLRKLVAELEREVRRVA